MFIAAIECAYEEYLASLRKAVDEHDLFSAQLAALFERHIEYFGRVASVFYFSAQIPLGEEIRRVISKCKDGFDLFLDELIERGRRAGEVRGEDVYKRQIQVSGLFDLAERTAGFPRIEVRSYACSVDGKDVYKRQAQTRGYYFNVE